MHRTRSHPSITLSVVLEKEVEQGIGSPNESFSWGPPPIWLVAGTGSLFRRLVMEIHASKETP